MRTIELGPWTLEVDREATEVAYAEIIDGAEDCTCAHCQHWAAHRDDIIAAPVRDFLESLGIDYRREAEVYDLDPRPALHLCAGWYHFIGRLTGGPRSREIPDASGTTIEMPDPHPIAPGFTVVPHDLLRARDEARDPGGSGGWGIDRHPRVLGDLAQDRA